MARTSRLTQSCPSADCELFGVPGESNITKQGFLKVKFGRRRRYRCMRCGKRFGKNTGTTYQGIHAPRSLFDQAIELSVEGVSISAIGRIVGRSRRTIARWLRKAARAAKRFNDHRIQGFELAEIQADEIRTFCGTKKKPSWIFMSIEVGARLWISTVVGKRGYASTRDLIFDTARRGRWARWEISVRIPPH